MKTLKRYFAAITLLALFNTSRPLPLNAQEWWATDCVHLGDYYYGNQGWHVIYCWNDITKDEFYIYEPI